MPAVGTVLVSAPLRLAKRDVPLFNTLEDVGVEIVIRPGGLWQVESMTGRLAMGGG